MQIIEDVLLFFILFLFWTLCIYLIHRISHIKSSRNVLYKIHLQHHRIDYAKKSNRKFKWYYLFFYFGDIYSTLDVLIMLTLPAVIIYMVFPRIGIYILLLHYIYEVFFSEGLLDHNPKIKGKVTYFFSWGTYHLYHHKVWNKNYSLLITLWDKIFKTGGDFK